MPFKSMYPNKQKYPNLGFKTDKKKMCLWTKDSDKGISSNHQMLGHNLSHEHNFSK